MIILAERLGTYDVFANFFINLLKDELSIIDRWDRTTRKNIIRLLLRPSLITPDQANFPEDPESRDLILSAIYLKNGNYALAKYHFDLLREARKQSLKNEIERLG
jgi:hypothetical protein